MMVFVTLGKYGIQLIINASHAHLEGMRTMGFVQIVLQVDTHHLMDQLLVRLAPNTATETVLV
jgi:hypothetical protein